MKKLTLIIAIVFSGILMQAQKSDEVAISLLGVHQDSIIEHFSTENNWHMIHHYYMNDAVVSIEIGNAVLVYKLDYKKYYRTDEVIVKYQHDNKAHLIELQGVKERRKYNKIKPGRFSTDVIFNY